MGTRLKAIMFLFGSLISVGNAATTVRPGFPLVHYSVQDASGRRHQVEVFEDGTLVVSKNLTTNSPPSQIRMRLELKTLELLKNRIKSINTTEAIVYPESICQGQAYYSKFLYVKVANYGDTAQFYPVREEIFNSGRCHIQQNHSGYADKLFNFMNSTLNLY